MMRVSYAAKLKTFLREALLLATAGFFVIMVIRLTEAGSLTPPGTPAPTMQTAQDIYNPLAGTYDSSTTTPRMTGSALEIIKCFITRENGGSC